MKFLGVGIIAHLRAWLASGSDACDRFRRNSVAFQVNMQPSVLFPVYPDVFPICVMFSASLFVFLGNQLHVEDSASASP